MGATSTNPTRLPVEVVLLHGFGLGSGSWEPVISELHESASDQLRVVAVELCPRGGYRPPPTQVTSLLPERPNGCRVLVGHSMGAHVALDLMALDPQWADAVLLVSVGSDEVDPEFFRSRAHAYADLLRSEGIEGFAERFLSERRFMDSSGTLRNARLLERVICEGDPEALAACADDYLAYEELTGELVARIAPSATWAYWTVLAGRGDEPAIAWIPSARTTMPGSRVQVVEDVAHLLPTDCPDRVALEILRLVDLAQAKATPR